MPAVPPTWPGDDFVRFPCNPGAFQTVLRGYADAFMTKLDAGRFIAGLLERISAQRERRGPRIAVDSAGFAYVSGFTDSPDFPATPRASQTTSAA